MGKKLPWDLIISKLKNNILPKQQERLDEWLSEGENNNIFVQLEALWNELRADASGYEPDLSSRWTELSLRLNLNSYNNLNKTSKIGSFWKMIAAASVAILAVLGGYFASNIVDNKNISTVSYSTMNGKSMINLPDGTLVWLHNNSTLSYDAGFGKKTRDLTFTGEAYFEVAHNSNVPFNVNANNIKIQVHGTKFNLRNRINEDRVTVSLIEGSLSVKSDRYNTRLNPGFETVYYRKTGNMQTTKGDVVFAAKWASESISFKESSFEYVTRYLAKWYDVDIRLNEHGRKADFAYTFTIHDESLEEIMRLISRISPIDYYFDEANTLYIDVKP